MAARANTWFKIETPPPGAHRHIPLYIVRFRKLRVCPARCRSLIGPHIVRHAHTHHHRMLTPRLLAHGSCKIVGARRTRARASTNATRQFIRTLIRFQFVNYRARFVDHPCTCPTTSAVIPGRSSALTTLLP